LDAKGLVLGSIKKIIMERTWFDFQKLDIYCKSQNYYIGNRRLLAQVKPPLYLQDQLSRASHSVVLNIAEGFGRISASDRRHFFIIARASLFESVACLDLMKLENRLSEEIYVRIMDSAARLSKMLYLLIKSLTPSNPKNHVW